MDEDEDEDKDQDEDEDKDEDEDEDEDEDPYFPPFLLSTASFPPFPLESSSRIRRAAAWSTEESLDRPSACLECVVENGACLTSVGRPTLLRVLRVFGEASLSRDEDEDSEPADELETDELDIINPPGYLSGKITTFFFIFGST